MRHIRCDVDEHPEIARYHGERHFHTLIIGEHKVIPLDEDHMPRLMQLLLAD